MNVEKRIAEYYQFDEEILQAVSATATRQNNLSFSELADQHGIGDGPEQVKPSVASNRTIEFYQLNPNGDYDESLLRICQAPMGIPADKSMAMRAMRLFASDPTVPLMIVGSPASIGNRANRLKLDELREVSRGNLIPAVIPILQFIMNRSVAEIEVVGYSYGADAGAAMMTAAGRFGLKAKRGVLIEPAGIKKQSVYSLAKSFGASGAELEGYVDRTESKPLFEARNRNQTAVAGFNGFARWAGGFLRASNLAITSGLARGTFGSQLNDALSTTEQSKVAVAWGSSSELVDVPAITQTVRSLNDDHYGRVFPLEIIGMHHGGGDDIDLHAAMVLQGLSLTRER